MTDTPALTVVSGSAFYQTFLDRGGWSNRPKISDRLKRKGQRARAMETTALRIPAWSTSPSGQLALGLEEHGPSIYGRPVVIGGDARAKDLPLLIGLASRYILDGCPENRLVQWTVEEAAEWLAYKHYGGRQATRVKQSVVRLMTVVLQNVTVRLGHGDPLPLDHAYHFIEDAWIVKRGKGLSSVLLHERFAQLLRLGLVTFLDDPTIRKLQRKDEVALRLWLFFESEGGPDRSAGWPYPVFMAPGQTMPCISQMAWLTGNRQYIVRRLRQAIKVLCEADDRYTITIDRKAQMIVRRQDDKTYEGVQSDVVDDASKTYEEVPERRTRRYEQDVREGTKSRSPKRRRNVVRTSNDPPSPSAIALRVDLDVLAAAWRRAPSEKQVTLIDIIRKQRRLNVEEAATAFREAIANNVDPIEALRNHRKPSRPVQLTIDPTPFCDGSSTAGVHAVGDDWEEHDDRSADGRRIALCTACRAEAAA